MYFEDSERDDEYEAYAQEVNLFHQQEEIKMLIAKNEGKEFERVGPGTYTGTCIWVIDLGTQKTTYKGEDKLLHKVLIGFELTNEKMENGQPFMALERYTVSLNEKANLRKMLEAWRGKAFTEEELQGFDIQKVLGQPALIGIVHNTSGDKTYVNISTVAKLMKGQTAPEPINQLIKFSLSDFNVDEFMKIPEFFQKKIEESYEYKHKFSSTTGPSSQSQESLDDDIPF